MRSDAAAVGIEPALAYEEGLPVCVQAVGALRFDVFGDLEELFSKTATRGIPCL